jgi:ABC-type multidrug transport system fused ATPase/permease subunit
MADPQVVSGAADLSAPSVKIKSFTRWQFVKLLSGWPFWSMVSLVFVEAVLSACVTWLIIQAGRDIVNDVFDTRIFIWILLAQGGSFALHTVSWIFGERAGFHAFARYMILFARDNRHHATLLSAKDIREDVEPFLTNETFHLLFETMYELEGTLQLAFGLLLNVLVIGHEIDGGFPIAYAVILLFVLALQFSARKPVARTYLNNQKLTNKMTSHTYTAWDNIFSGNSYNFRLWHVRFKERLNNALKAQVKAIVVRETLSSISGIVGLIVIFATMAWVVNKDGSETTLLVALAATLPKQISLTHDIHSFAIGWNDLLALWTRVGGVVSHMHPQPPQDVAQRIDFGRMQLRQGDTTMTCSSLADAVNIVKMQPTGRIQVRAGNGAGKSTLLAALKQALEGQAYYWPTTDRLAFQFTQAKGSAVQIDDDDEEDDNSDLPDSSAEQLSQLQGQRGYSSGERQIASLAEIVQTTSQPYYLLDEWDANLDEQHRERANHWVEQLAARARVVEISHRR